MNIVESALGRLLGRQSVWLIWRRAANGKELVSAKCTVCRAEGNRWTGNSRANIDDAMADMLRHVRVTHSAKMRKHERDVERSIRLQNERKS